MKKPVRYPPRISTREFSRRAHQILQELQKTLLPEHASEILAINVETGEYVVAPTDDEAYEEFEKRWPDQLSYVVRVDGGPVVTFRGRGPLTRGAGPCLRNRFGRA
jgi:hypothetical protein